MQQVTGKRRVKKAEVLTQEVVAKPKKLLKPAKSQPEITNKRVRKVRQKTEEKLNLEVQEAKGRAKRTKERTIADIIEKVSNWRKLYNGVLVPSDNPDKEGELQRWSLEEAAGKVGVSKKSLDDYLLQLRFGKKFGFDFEINRDSKVGILRLFVKQEKEKIKGGQKGIKISSKSENEDDNIR